jgi:hypothetical protein
MKNIIKTTLANVLVRNEGLDEENRYCVEYAFSPNGDKDNIIEGDMDYEYFETEQEAEDFITNSILVNEKSCWDEVLALDTLRNVNVGERSFYVLGFDKSITKLEDKRNFYIITSKQLEAIYVSYWSNCSFYDIDFNGEEVPNFMPGDLLDCLTFNYDDIIFEDDFEFQC